MRDEHPRPRASATIGDIAFGKRHSKIQGHGKRGGHPIPHVVVGGVEKKSCARCARLLPLGEFAPNPNKGDGLSSRCRECASAGGDSSSNGERERRGFM